MTDESRVARLLGEWQRARDSGNAPKPEVLIAGHPDIADELRAGLATIRALDRMLAGGAEGIEGPGTVIGRYKLLQRIGEGGFGVVYLAEQTEPVRRQVALKVIKLGMDTKQVIARFEAERQTLALMEHPHIAKVLDAGATQQGRPYFVMELVKGVPITEYCDHARLTVANRLELFQQVCAAVQHAHQKGIIHRDIKPSNVLVTEYDGTPVPKVIDFGIAKATDHRLAEKTLFTEFRQMVGTPEYMSPEQTGLNSLDVDTRTDIYSLGVLLYELLTGTKPFELAEVLESGYEEMLRHIRDVDPPKPSTRVSALEEPLADTARSRRTAAGTLGKSLRGDLDWIVMKALEKDRTRRYETANGLAMDIARHLRDEPVLAGPPSARYRVRKYVRRHSVAVTAAATVVVALAAGIAFAWSGYREASRERGVAETNEAEAIVEAARANEVISLIREMLGSADPHEGKGADYTVRQLLDDFDRELGDRLKDQPEVEATLRATMGEAYWSLGLFDKAAPHLEIALEIRKRVLGEHELVAESLMALAKVHFEWERYDEAEPLYEEAVAMQRRVREAGHPAIAVALRDLAELRSFGGGGPGEVEALLRESLAIFRGAYGEEHSETARTLVLLGWALRDNAAEAERMLEKAVAILRKTDGDEHPYVTRALEAQASLARGAGRYDEAAVLFQDVLRRRRESLGDEHSNVADTKWILSWVLQALGEYVEAERLALESLETRRRIYGDDHYLITQSLFVLRTAFQGAGKYADAERVARENVALLIRIRGEEHYKVAAALGYLAEALAARGNYPEAEVRAREALAMYEREASRGSTWGPLSGAFIQEGLARVLWKSGQLAEAERRAKEALATKRTVHGDEHPDVAKTLRTLALVVGTAGRPDDAEALHREALAMNREYLGDEHFQVATNLHDLAELLLSRGRFSDAEPPARESMETSERIRPTHWLRFSAMSVLGASLAGEGKYADAEPLLIQGYEKMEPPGDPAPRQRALERVIQLYERWGRPAEAAKWRAKRTNETPR